MRQVSSLPFTSQVSRLNGSRAEAHLYNTPTALIKHRLTLFATKTRKGEKPQFPRCVIDHRRAKARADWLVFRQELQVEQAGGVWGVASSDNT